MHSKGKRKLSQKPDAHANRRRLRVSAFPPPGRAQNKSCCLARWDNRVSNCELDTTNFPRRRICSQAYPQRAQYASKVFLAAWWSGSFDLARSRSLRHWPARCRVHMCTVLNNSTSEHPDLGRCITYLKLLVLHVPCAGASPLPLSAFK